MQRIDTHDYGCRREVACFQEICDHAAAFGIAIGMQNHPSTGEHMQRIHRQVDRENFTLVLDTGQWVGGANGNRGPADEQVYGWMEECAPLAAHCRAKFFKIDSGSYYACRAEAVHVYCQHATSPFHFRRCFNRTGGGVSRLTASRFWTGSEEWLDYPRILKLLHSAGYNGTLGIVFEGAPTSLPPRHCSCSPTLSPTCI